MDDLEMMKKQTEARFAHDQQGRLQHSGPRFFLGWTKGGNLRCFRNDLPSQIIKQLDDLFTQEPTVNDLQSPPVYLKQFQDILQTHMPIQQVNMGLAYRFPNEIRSPTVHLVQISSENVTLLKEMMPDLNVDLPCVAVVKEGRAVSACQSVWVNSGFHEAGVDTLQAYRGRGYATATVAGWAKIVLKLGCIPHYSTTVDNVASQGAARKLCLTLYGADLRIT